MPPDLAEFLLLSGSQITTQVPVSKLNMIPTPSKSFAELLKLRRPEPELKFQIPIRAPIQGTVEAPWRLWDLLDDLKDKMELLQATVYHCFREANMVSDELATWGVNGCNLIYENQDQLPQKAKGLLLLDIQAFPTLRKTK
ncbi:hypothetical protein Droror1_Dr00022520 [Drosera rotundifolia]